MAEEITLEAHAAEKAPGATRRRGIAVGLAISIAVGQRQRGHS